MKLLLVLIWNHMIITTYEYIFSLTFVYIFSKKKFEGKIMFLGLCEGYNQSAQI